MSAGLIYVQSQKLTALVKASEVEGEARLEERKTHLEQIDQLTAKVEQSEAFLLSMKTRFIPNRVIRDPPATLRRVCNDRPGV